MKKVLVTGSNGLLGSKIVAEAIGRYAVYPTHATRPFFPKSLKVDITDKKEVDQVLNKVKPDILVHAAAETNVDKCERDKSYALAVNGEGTKILAEACGRMNGRFVYLSTDYVFDGEKGLYVEEDDPNPVNHYGVTKLMGEKYVAELCESFAILRTSVLYGLHPVKPNFAKWVITSLAEERAVNVVEDHFNSPTLADNLAEVVVEIIDRNMEGLYHAAGSERVSRYAFALKIAETFGFDAGLVKPIRMGELEAWIARRPKDSSLCVDKIRKEIDIELLGVSRGLREMKKKWAEAR